MTTKGISKVLFNVFCFSVFYVYFLNMKKIHIFTSDLSLKKKLNCTKNIFFKRKTSIFQHNLGLVSRRKRINGG